MKISLGSVVLVAALGSAAASVTGKIPYSLSKAAREATRSSRKLRRLEQKRLRAFNANLGGDLKPKAKEAFNPEAEAERHLRSEERHLDQNQNQNYNYNYNQYNQNGGNGNYNGNQQYQNQNGGNYQQYNNGQYQNGDDNVNDASEQWYNNQNQWGYEQFDQDYDLDYSMDNNAAFGFDISEYSFHYTGCSAIKSYNDELAQDEDSDTVLMSNRMATFRLCKSNQCRSNSYNGCSSNYGEYVTSMDQFLIGMYQLEEDRVMAYCTMCEECANIEAFKRWYQEMQYHKEVVLESSAASYEAFLENWEATYGDQAADDADANANANYNYNANGNYNYNYNADGEDGDGYDGQNAYQGNQDAAMAYYKKLTSGNYANNYVYGNYQNQYQQNQGNQGYNYQNGEQYYNNQYNANGNANYNYNYNGQQQNYNNGNGYQSYNNGNQYGYGYNNQNGQGEAQNVENWDYVWNNYNMNQFQNQGGNNNMYYNAANAWSNMGAWYGKRIVNGYIEYGNNGATTFVEEWGFMDSDGVFHSLEGDDAIADMEWEDLPEGWEEMLEQGDEVESCSYSDSGSCYNQFFSCMQVLGEEDEYQEMIEQYNEQIYGEDAEANERRATIQDYMECQQIDLDGAMEAYQQNRNQYYENGDQYNQYQYQDAYGNYYNNGDQNEQSNYWAAQANSNVNYNQYANEDGEVELYVGPYCDGDKISLGVYDDAYCSHHVEGLAVEDILGYDPTVGEDNFDIVPTECVSCAYDEVSNSENMRKFASHLSPSSPNMSIVSFIFSFPCSL